MKTVYPLPTLPTNCVCGGGGVCACVVGGKEEEEGEGNKIIATSMANVLRCYLIKYSR